MNSLRGHSYSIPPSVRIRVLLMLMLSCLLLAANARGADSDGTDIRLSNGMRVIFKPDHRSPVAVSLLCYRVGSMDEFNGTTGVAHALEHMMFKGTPEVPAGQFSRLISAAGGRENAFTGKDATCYFEMLQKSKLDLALKLEADRMTHLTLAASDFAEEIKVVMEERRMRTDDQPHALVYEHLMAAAFMANPYRRPVIGWMNDLEHLRIQDVRHFYHEWYAPDNAVLVIAGDFKPDDAFARARRYFGDIKSRKLPLRKPQVEPPQRGIRRIAVKAPAELPFLLMGWHVPVLRDARTDWEPYALDVLVGVLDGNGAARLPRILVKENGVANDVDAGYSDTSRGPGMFYVSATPAIGKTVPQTEVAVRALLQRLIDNGITPDELARVKAQVVADQVYARDSIFFQARQIAMTEMAGIPYTTLDLQIEKLKQVTAEQVQQVAKKYLKDDNLTLAYLVPQPLHGRKPAPPHGIPHEVH
ncbi:MAG TPA: pitrilysin family protein [Burkholderiales bacterium]|nr:pitrilysin family protein [Burkholderiales bacterium]